MPWVDLHSKTDYATIFYTTNTTYSNVGGFDPEKPTVVVLPPLFLDSTWTDTQLGDSRFNNHFNLIAFDIRSSGRSTCRPNAAHDSWVDAADLGLCFQRLHLPPSHILALEGTSVCCALRFAVLFPEMCLSLTLVNVPPSTELKWIYNNIDQSVHDASFAEDIESFDHAAAQVIQHIFGTETDPDLVEDLITYWEVNFSPSKRLRAIETANLYINRAPMSAEALASITQPVVIIQGDKNTLSPMKYAERLVSQLTRVKDGPAVLYQVKGGPSMVSLVSNFSNIVNKTVFRFLSRLPHHRSDLDPPSMSIEDRMKAALNTLAEFEGLNITNLDPLSSISFCCLDSDALKIQSMALKEYATDIHEAFTPIPSEGRAMRASDKNKDEWSYLEPGRPSINSTTIVPSERVKQEDLERGQRPPTRSDSSQISPNDPTAPLMKSFLIAGPIPNDRNTSNMKKPRTRVIDNPQSATVPMQRMLASPF